MVEVRAIREDDWQLLKEIRLEALEDSPEAFLTTLAEAKAHGDDLWRDRASAGAKGTSQRTMIALDGVTPVGLAIGLRRTEPPRDLVPIVSVFVSKPYRRANVGARLMEAVEGWANTVGATRASLWVVDSNAAARRFYESLGYVATTDQHDLEKPSRCETRYEKVLTPSG